MLLRQCRLVLVGPRALESIQAVREIDTLSVYKRFTPKSLMRPEEISS